MTGAQSSERVTLASQTDQALAYLSKQWGEAIRGRVVRDLDEAEAGLRAALDAERRVAPSTPATTGEGEVERLKADLKDEINFDLNTRVNKVPESVVDQVVDLLAERGVLTIAALPPSSGWEAGAEAMKRAAVAMLRSRHKGAEHLREYAEAQYAALQIEETLPLPPPPSREGA